MITVLPSPTYPHPDTLPPLEQPIPAGWALVYVFTPDQAQPGDLLLSDQYNLYDSVYLGAGIQREADGRTWLLEDWQVSHGRAVLRPPATYPVTTETIRAAKLRNHREFLEELASSGRWQVEARFDYPGGLHLVSWHEWK